MLERLQNLFSRVSQTLSILHDLPLISPREEMFRYAGYEIPVRLVNLTGGGPDTWEVISQGHMEQYRKYCPIEPEHLVLELGCGVGRDAIQLTQLLSPKDPRMGRTWSSCADAVSTRAPRPDSPHRGRSFDTRGAR